MMTDREAFEKWFKAEWNADYYPTEAMYLAWQAATLAERERCALIAENYVEIIELKRMVLAREIRGAR